MDFFVQHFSQLIDKLFEQFYLVGISTGIAILIGIPAGISIAYFKKTRAIILGFANILQTIPSLALLVFLLPFFGIGAKSAIVALTLYALLPIIRNTLAGLESIPAATIDAAKGLGFTPKQRLLIVELPLALPIILTGVRTAAVISVGIATLAAFIGGGGLGDFITQGLALNNTPLVLLGAIPAALMALLIDFLIGRLEHYLSKHRQTKPIRGSLFILIGLLFAFVVLAISPLLINRNNPNTIIVASKNFSEQFILGEMIAKMLEAHTQLKVIRKFNLGSTAICHEALLQKEIDIYPEYTGTAYMIVLKLKNPGTPEQVFQTVKKEYEKQFQLTWLSPFGFNNSQALVVRSAFAKQMHLKTISDLAIISQRLSIAAPPEFTLREDALPGLIKAYHLQFAKIFQLEPNLMFSAIANNKVEVIAAFSTDGRIPEFDLVRLIDDKHFYPPYYAAPIIRENVLKAHPEIAKALKPLAGLSNDEDIQALNYEVDVNKKSPMQVADEYLHSKGLI